MPRTIVGKGPYRKNSSSSMVTAACMPPCRRFAYKGKSCVYSNIRVLQAPMQSLVATSAIFVAAVVALQKGGAPCASALDCSLNGHCQNRCVYAAHATKFTSIRTQQMQPVPLLFPCTGTLPAHVPCRLCRCQAAWTSPNCSRMDFVPWYNLAIHNPHAHYAAHRGRRRHINNINNINAGNSQRNWLPWALESVYPLFFLYHCQMSPWPCHHLV